MTRSRRRPRPTPDEDRFRPVAPSGRLVDLLCRLSDCGVGLPRNATFAGIGVLHFVVHVYASTRVVGVAQRLERRTVAPEAAGSSPVIHPTQLIPRQSLSNFPSRRLHYVSTAGGDAGGCSRPMALDCRRTQVYVPLGHREILMAGQFLNRPRRRSGADGLSGRHIRMIRRRLGLTHLYEPFRILRFLMTASGLG